MCLTQLILTTRNPGDLQARNVNKILCVPVNSAESRLSSFSFLFTRKKTIYNNIPTINASRRMRPPISRFSASGYMIQPGLNRVLQDAQRFSTHSQTTTLSHHQLYGHGAAGRRTDSGYHRSGISALPVCLPAWNCCSLSLSP